MMLKINDIVVVNDTYRICEQTTVLVVNTSLYPKAETGARFGGIILNGAANKSEIFKESDIMMNYGSISLKKFKLLFPELLL